MKLFLTCAPAIFKTTIERHSYESTGVIKSFFTVGRCNRQFDKPNSLTAVNVKNARIAENVVEFCGEKKTENNYFIADKIILFGIVEKRVLHQHENSNHPNLKASMKRN